MPQVLLRLLFASSVVHLAMSQITGSYLPLPTNAPTPGGPGTDLANYPQCAVRYRRGS